MSSYNFTSKVPGRVWHKSRRDSVYQVPRRKINFCWPLRIRVTSNSWWKNSLPLSLLRLRLSKSRWKEESGVCESGSLCCWRSLCFANLKPSKSKRGGVGDKRQINSDLIRWVWEEQVSSVIELISNKIYPPVCRVTRVVLIIIVRKSRVFTGSNLLSNMW